MLQLAAFADEISPDLDEQVRACVREGVTHVELRSVANVNVLDFSPEMRRRVRTTLGRAGLKVVSIGSPIGKVKISEPFEPHFERFGTAVELAEYFGAPLLRVFSYYPPEAGASMLPYRDEVVGRMRAKVEYVAGRTVQIVHENEKDIFGERGAQCVDLMRAVDSAQFRSAFDFANFVQAGERPMDNWAGLKPYVTHIHVKDARLAGGVVTPAGEGDGQIGAILSDAHRSGYGGFVSLEPHLAAAGKFGGYSGGELFKVAVDALKKVCRENKIPLAVGSSGGGGAGAVG